MKPIELAFVNGTVQINFEVNRLNQLSNKHI